MKKIIAVLFLLVSINSFAQINVVPMPAEVKMGKGELVLKEPIGFIFNDRVNKGVGGVKLFKQYLTNKYGITKFKEGDTHSYGLSTEIFIEIDNKSKNESYSLKVESKSILIKGSNKGIFYAFETLKQLITKQKNNLTIKQLSIADSARFPYRGMHLDVCRHFFDVAYVKKYIDYLAAYKFNTFHWHLTEDQGWRIEIKKYPNLTKVGAYRDRTLIGRYGSNIYDSIKYGGYYTQEEIKEVVKYATDRFITVIPEIEMPGHSTAALASYPFLGCTKGPYKTMDTWGVLDDVYCAGNDSTFTFLQNVLDEVMQLFPSKYIHIGGDECPKERWKKCAACQQRMKDNNLKDEHALQSYFIQRMEKYLNSKGRSIIGWDEILEGGLAPNATVMSWRGEEGGIEAAKQNHDVIMTPGSHCYLDHSQSKNEDSLTIGSYLPLEKIYSYEPIPTSLTATQAKHILGAQGNVWTEYIANTNKLEYMIFPRMSALSEVLWSPKDKRDWKDFERRLPNIFEKLDAAKINYSKAYYDLKATVLPTENNDGVYWKLVSVTNEPIKINFNRGDSIWNYTEPQRINSYVSTAFASIKKTRLSQKFHFNKATGKKITLTYPPTKPYEADGAFTLVNGVQNEKGMARTSEFVGFVGTDLEAIIDLGKETEIKKVLLHTFQKTNSWIYHPKQGGISVFVSDDGINFKMPEDEIGSVMPNELGVSSISFNHSGTSIKTRFVKVIAKNFGTIPAGQPGEGKGAWLFVDEIEVE
jgi:hexosaminidase